MSSIALDVIFFHSVNNIFHDFFFILYGSYQIFISTHLLIIWNLLFSYLLFSWFIFTIPRKMLVMQCLRMFWTWSPNNTLRGYQEKGLFISLLTPQKGRKISNGHDCHLKVPETSWSQTFGFPILAFSQNYTWQNLNVDLSPLWSCVKFSGMKNLYPLGFQFLEA